MKHMEVWALINSKGGVGKSTLTVNIAHYLMSLGKEVCIVDSDPQGSIRDWQETGQLSQFSVLGLDRRQALKTLPFMVDSDNYDYCLIDTPGRIVEIQAVAISLSKKIFIPVQPSSYDIWASGDIVELIKSRQLALAELPECPISAFIINRAIPNTIISREVRDALKEFDFPVINQSIAQRVSYATTITDGQTILSSKDMKARQEMALLVTELQDFKG